MSEAAVMAAPDANLPYTLCTDASGIGIGAVLEQELQGEVRPIAYYSRKLQPREMKYSATELEALAIHDAVKHFAIYLLGSTFTVVTDHKALIFMETMKHCSARVNRWVCELQPYQFSTRYRKGSENALPDALSRELPGEHLTDHTQPPEEGGGVGPAQPETQD